MPNNIEGAEVAAGLRVREAALIAHCLPLGELQVTLGDGRNFLVGAHPRAMMTPCMFRLAVAQHRAGRDQAAWVGRIASATLSSPSIRSEGTGLYSGWCAGTPVYAFSSTLNPAVLTTAIEALPDGEVEVRVLPDVELGLTLVALEAQADMAPDALAALAREVQATVLVAELETELRAA